MSTKPSLQEIIAQRLRETADKKKARDQAINQERFQGPRNGSPKGPSSQNDQPWRNNPFSRDRNGSNGLERSRTGDGNRNKPFQGDRKRPFQGNRSGGPNNKNSPNNRNQRAASQAKSSEPNKLVIPKWEYGTDLEKQYMNELLKTIYTINEDGRVSYVSPTGDIEYASVLKYIDTVPENHVLGIVDIQEQRGEKVAFIKLFERKVKLQEFSDKLAEEKTKLFGRTRKNKRISSLKSIKVSWEISQKDLDNQKTNEIMGHLKKGYKIRLVIGQKDLIGRRNFNFNKEAIEAEEIEDEFDAFNEDDLYESKNFQELYPYEEARRNKVLEQIKSVFEELAKIEIKGDIRHKIVINAEPLVKEEAKKEEKKSLKDQKKAERRLKEQLRQEKKKAKMESKKNQVSTLLQDGDVNEML